MILHEDCLNTTKSGAYSCMWHVHGLASVLKRPVVSIYPDFNPRYRSLFNRECQPRTTSAYRSDTRALIMWTTTKRGPKGTFTWSPNHFVPCYDFTTAPSGPHLKPSSGHQTQEPNATSKRPPLPKKPNPTPKQPGTSSNPSCPTPWSSKDFQSHSPVAVPTQFPSSVTNIAPCNPPRKQFPFQIPPTRQSSRRTSPGLTYSSVTKASLASPPQEQPTSTVPPSKLPASLETNQSSSSVVAISSLIPPSKQAASSSSIISEANQIPSTSVTTHCTSDRVQPKLRGITAGDIFNVIVSHNPPKQQRKRSSKNFSDKPWKSSCAVQKQFPPPATVQKQFPPQATVQKQFPPQVTVQKQFPPPATVQKQFPPPVTVQKQFPPQATVQKQFPPPVTVQKQFPPPVTVQKQFSPPVTVQKQFPPQATVQKQFPPPATVQKQFPPPVTVQKQFPPPVTVQKQFPPQATVQKQFPPPVTVQKQFPPPVTVQKQFPPPATVQKQSMQTQSATHLSKLSTTSLPSVSTLLKLQTMSKVSTKGAVPTATLSRFLIPTQKHNIQSKPVLSPTATPTCPPQALKESELKPPSSQTIAKAPSVSSLFLQGLKKRVPQHGSGKSSSTLQFPAATSHPKTSTSDPTIQLCPQALTAAPTWPESSTKPPPLVSVSPLFLRQGPSANTQSHLETVTSPPSPPSWFLHGSISTMENDTVQETVCDDSPYPTDSENLSIGSSDDGSFNESSANSQSDMDESSLAHEQDSIPTMSPPDAQACTDEIKKLPFPNLPRSWYAKEQRLYNVARDTLRRTRPIEKDSTDAILCMNRSQVQGSLESNMETLGQTLSDPCSSAKACHYKAICETATYILANGPLVKTQDAGMVYLKYKGLDTRKRSVEYYEIFSKHLNLVQVYIFDTAYLLPNTCGNMECFVNTIQRSVNTGQIIRENITDRLKELFQSSLEYMDTHRDRQVMKALFAELTSVNFTTKLQGLHSRQGTTSAKKALSPNLHKFADIKTSSQTVRSDLTTLQQHRLTQRTVSARKLKEIRTIAEGRGRKLKSKEFPELGLALEYAFGECDTENGGGGLEAHPRLTTGTLYRGVDNATTMKRAREILLSMAPMGFTISLSSCYNFTENYRHGSAQAKRHHSGRGVNATISLKKPPRTGVQELVVNLHWSTCNVNYSIDRSQKHKSLVLSKDAKAVVMADIAPVQLPGHSWKKRELPDHTWDQSRTNAITPMTFLFLETRLTSTDTTSQDTVMHITRTGQGVTLLYLSFFEPDTTFKCMNEIFLLLANPSLDHLFRDSETGGLKKEFTFVVDNGPQEKPSSPLVQMCMARLLRFLKLDKITQLSFAEYHSKRNFVERVHAEENRVLSKHGPFSSHEVHQSQAAGSNEHRENMEHMADSVSRCLQEATFGGKPLLCYRGIKCKDFLFDDEDSLTTFLSLSEQGKEEFTKSYKVGSCDLLTQLHFAWGMDLDFEGDYLDDYQLLNNDLVKERTAWRDKYTTALYSPVNGIMCSRKELQPIPDILRWLNCYELHYMPWQEASLLEHGPWDDIPGLFLPTKILDLCFSTMPTPPPDIARLVALLAWITPDEAKEYYSKLHTQVNNTLETDQQRGKWKNHPLYVSNNKEELEKLCRSLKIPVTPATTKHQLVILISKKRGERESNDTTESPYSGGLANVPKTVTAINHLPVAKLREILHHHGFPVMGNKDQLTLRIYLLRHGQTAAITAREEEQLNDFIRIFKLLVLAQRKLKLSNHTYQKRTFSTKAYKQMISPPDHISASNAHELFEPVIAYLDNQRKQREEKDNRGTVHLVTGVPMSHSSLKEKLSQVGAKVKIKWTLDEIGDSGWRPGWYIAYVQAYDDETDTLTVKYPSEPDCTYTVELFPFIRNSKIQLVNAVI